MYQLLRAQHPKILSSLQGLSHLAQQGVSDHLILHGQHSAKPNVHALLSMKVYVEILSCMMDLCASHAVSGRLSSTVQGTLGCEDQ